MSTTTSSVTKKPALKPPPPKKHEAKAQSTPNDIDKKAAPSPAAPSPAISDVQMGIAPDKTLTPEAKAFLEDATIKNKFNTLATYKQLVATNLSSAAASLSAQDMEDIDAGTTDMEKYNGVAAQFYNEIVSDNESINGFVKVAGNNLESAQVVMKDIRDAALARGLNYEQSVEPFVLSSSVGDTIKGAELNLATVKGVVDKETIRYANKLADKAQQYLDGFEVVKKNQKLDAINNAITGIASIMSASAWGIGGTWKGFANIEAIVQKSRVWENWYRFHGADAGDVTGMISIYAQAAWKGGSPISAPAMEKLLAETPVGTPVDLHAWDAAANSDLDTSLLNMKSRLGTLHDKMLATRKELEDLAWQDPDDSNWFIPGV